MEGIGVLAAMGDECACGLDDDHEVDRAHAVTNAVKFYVVSISA